MSTSDHRTRVLRRSAAWIRDAFLAPGERGPLASVLVAALFAVALGFVHRHHEFWRDEMHCWALGRSASGLGDLVFGIRRYDGHPFLWYALLHVVSRLVRGPFGLHAVGVGLATISSYLWFRRSGFPRFLRLLLLPSYLWFYEYGVMTRSYGLGITLICLFCAITRRHHPRYVASSILLALLALTSAFGSLIAVALAFFLFATGVSVRRTVAWPWISIGGLTRRWGAGVAILAAGAAVAVLTSLPPPDATMQPAWKALTADNLIAELRGFWSALLPSGPDWWSATSVGVGVTALAPFIPWLAGALFVAFFASLRRRPLVAITYAFGVGLIATFEVTIYGGGLRHKGHFFILLLACGWLANRSLDRPRPLPLYGGLMALVLLFQIAFAIRATAVDLREPFSAASQAADFLRPRLPDDARIIGSDDHQVSPVAGYLDRPFILDPTGEPRQTVVYRGSAGWVEKQGLFPLAARIVPEGKPVFFVLSYPLQVVAEGDLVARLIHVTPAAIVRDEQYFIYRVGPAGAIP